MPADSAALYYLDSNVLLAYLNNEPGRGDVVGGLLQMAKNRRVSLITSVLTVTEVVYASEEITNGRLTSEVSGSIAALWAPSSPVMPVDASMVTSEKARGLIRQAKQAGFGIKPYDAQHLAAACLHNAEVLFTYEKDSTRAQWAEIAGIRVEEPFVLEPTLL